MRIPVLAGLLLCTLFLHIHAAAQVEAAIDPASNESTPFYVDPICFAALNSNLTRLDLFILVGYENLAFVKNEDKYNASYEVTVSIKDSEERLVNEKLWTEKVSTANFDESVSSQAFHLTQRTFELSPGKYTVTLAASDNEGSGTKLAVRNVTVPDFNSASFLMSDLMLVKRLSMNGDRKTIVPNVSSNVGNLPDGFHLFFEAYNNADEDSVKFIATALNEKRERKYSTDTTLALKKGRNQAFIKMDNSGLPLGNYVVEVQAFNKAGVLLGTSSKGFIIRWTGLPRGVADLDLAVDQIQYIATDKQIDYIKEAPTPEEKQKRFMEFWKSKDKNPNTPRNEKMEEYYGRVEYANKHFKHYIEGWRTDMGMVYIIFGAPNNVDRHPFDIDSKPYEVWSYYDLNHQFVFIDQTGFGDYRLTTPIWEVWQRPKD